MPQHDRWYEIVDDDTLRQGDICRGVLVWWLPEDLPQVEPEQQAPVGRPDAEERPAQPAADIEWQRGTWILANASCDVAQSRIERVLLIEVREASEENVKATGKEFQQRLEVIRRGMDHARFLLAEHPDIDPPFPESYVLYRSQVMLPIGYLTAQLQGRSRLRLRHPFREQFGNWISARFSDIGPEDEALIPRKVPKLYAGQILRAVPED